MLCWRKGLESCNTSSCHSGIHYCKPLSISNDYFSLTPCGSHKSEAYQHQLASRSAGAVTIFTRSRNAATGDNSMYCMIPDPFPSTAFGKGSTTPD